MKVGTCIHFNGVQHDQCDAGVNYDSFAPAKRMRSELPCIKVLGGLPSWDGEKSCPLYLDPTPEQIKAFEFDLEKAIEGVAISRNAIIEHTHYDFKARPRRGGHGTIDCPVCGTGQMSYTISGYNGHMSARCTTKDCVNWIE